MSVNTLTEQELWSQFTAIAKELRYRNQIALHWWSVDDIEEEFERLLFHYDDFDMEDHREGFRRFALAKISLFLGHDASFNGRVKRELAKWFKDRLGTVAPLLPHWDYQGHFNSCADNDAAQNAPAQAGSGV